MASMVKEYGAKKAKEVFYASINKGVAGSSKWHRKKTGNYSHDVVKMAIEKSKKT